MINYPLSQALSLAEGTCHGVPDEPMDIPAAHRYMQVHLECRSWACPVKREALATLVESGRIRPDYDKYDL